MENLGFFLHPSCLEHLRKKNAELRRIKEEEDEMGYEDEYDDAEEEDDMTPVFTRTESSSRLRSTESSKRLLTLQKPLEPDFDAE